MRSSVSPDDMEQLIATVRSRGYFVSEKPNQYDRNDMVRKLGMMRAGALKLAAYKVRDPETFEWSSLQFHMTFDNCVMAMLSEESAKLFATFVNMQLEPKNEQPA